ncbi:DUF6233 domain-containing protein [Streptomyces sp. NPDC089424]|uniref:DUF6233 domain-containing protein n=1 Tax=Streptomyces sp. NPDC089424 TaxID=3365917 RepID=UPI0037FDEACA
MRTTDAERRQGAELRPAPPQWLVQYGLNHTNIDAVHVGDCYAAARSGRCRPATQQQAIDALRQHVRPCIHCRPDTALGLLDQAGGLRPRWQAHEEGQAGPRPETQGHRTADRG